MDGRYEEVYPIKLLETEQRFETQSEENTNSVLNDYKTDLVILYKPIYEIKKPDFDSSLLTMDKIYEDNYWLLFAKKDLNQKDFKIPTFDKNKIYDSLFETSITPDLLKETQK